MKRFALLLILLAGGTLSPTAFAGCATGAAVFSQVQPQLTAFRDYQIRLYNQQDCDNEPDSPIGAVEILKAGKQIYAQSGYSFALGYPLDQDQPPDSVKPVVGMDFTGEGQPELLISEWSGGAHCCYTFHLFRLGQDFRKVQSIPLRDADESAFVRREGHKGLVLVSTDYSAFAYFPFDFAGSPAGRMFLSFQGGRFKLDTALMKANAPKPEDLAECARLFKKSRDWRNKDQPQPLGLWYYATDLIYTGNADAAWKFLEAAWGGSTKDKAGYIGDYKARLRKSAYYPELMDLQKTPASGENQQIDWTKQCFEYMHG
ncbi:MAG: hypothetical protein ACM3ZT_05740 [Bacillota bacterium]